MGVPFYEEIWNERERSRSYARKDEKEEEVLKTADISTRLATDSRQGEGRNLRRTRRLAQTNLTGGSLR